MSATKIMIMRHAEKPEGDDSVGGGDKSGAGQNKHDLTPRGWQRAGALVRFFVPRDGQDYADGIATPDALFVPEIRDGNHGIRPHHTLAPLEELLVKEQRLTEPTIIEFGLDDFGGLIEAAKAVNGNALIVWEHKRIPRIAAQLPVVSCSLPTHWPGNRFDIVWVFDRAPEGWSFKQVPQLLLAGDDEDPIGQDEAHATIG